MSGKVLPCAILYVVNESDAVAALELMTRALIGITLHSLEVLGGEVSLPQFRLLLIAAGLGRVPSSRIAAMRRSIRATASS